MNCTSQPLHIALGAALCLLLTACSTEQEQASTTPMEEHDAPPTNRIAVPEAVRSNLGIRFVTVERRDVRGTLRVPGHFELLPGGRRDYHAPLGGRVEIEVELLQQVQVGDLLFRIDSPQWRATQQQLQDLELDIASCRIRQENLAPVLRAHEEHEASLRRAADVIEARIAQLEQTRQELGGQAAELAQTQMQLAQTEAELAQTGEAHAEAQANIAELAARLQANEGRLELLLAAAATMTGVDEGKLRSRFGKGGWRDVRWIEVRASDVGAVESLPVASGAWVEAGALVATASDIRRVRFAARGLQSDLARLQDGLRSRVVPPSTLRKSLVDGSAATVEGSLQLGVVADPQQRTVDLYVTPTDAPSWARPGVAGFLEVETAKGGGNELCVPLGAVLQDGLQRVMFLRDPKDEDQVIRLEADLGVDDGAWIEVLSGLADGDQVVLEGAYELVLASSDSAQKGGHFHADGTWHADDHK